MQDNNLFDKSFYNDIEILVKKYPLLEKIKDEISKNEKVYFTIKSFDNYITHVDCFVDLLNQGKKLTLNTLKSFDKIKGYYLSDKDNREENIEDVKVSLGINQNLYKYL